MAHMHWGASTDNVGVDHYVLYVNGSVVTNTTGTGYTFTGLNCGTHYTLGVKAVDAAGNQSGTATLGANTSACA